MNNFEKIKQMNLKEMSKTIEYLYFLIFMGAGNFDIKQWLQ